MISAGLTRQVVNVTRASTLLDPLGRRVQTYVNYGQFRADVREAAPQEQPFADGVASICTFEIRLRWPNVARLLITPIDRLVYRGRFLRINGIRNLNQQNRVAIIDATEVV